MSTIKTKNIKQTVISGTTQPLKIGGILENGSDAKISIDTNGNTYFSQVTGIKFPATQNPSADANTLDDYEEGGFTPTISGSGTAGTGTYSIQVGRYTKIGKIVHVYASVSWTNHTGAGYIQITNLPFTSFNQSHYYPVSSTTISNITLYANYYSANGYFTPNTNIITLSQTPIGGGPDSTISMDTSGFVYLSVTYEATN